MRSFAGHFFLSVYGVWERILLRFDTVNREPQRFVNFCVVIQQASESADTEYG